jgi:cysteine desulfurase
VSLIYLDYNRTTPVAPSVLEAMEPFWATHYMLPGQDHAHAQLVSEALESAREGLAALVGCEPFEVIFTSGGTESNNLGILGMLAKKKSGHVLVSILEHDSVVSAVNSLGDDWLVETVDCGDDGLVDPEYLQTRIREDTRLVCLQAANPVLGTIQPVREVADICHTRGVPLHCDATQIFGKLPTDVTQLRADTVAISGHKFYGPKGSGALYVRRGLEISPIGFGEPREMGLRPGSENVPAYVGLGAAAALAARCSVDVANNLAVLRDRFAAGLQAVLDPVPVIACQNSPRLPNTLTFQLGCNARKIQQAARELAMASAQSHTPPDEMTRMLRAIGCSDDEIERTIRVSVGWTTSRDQIDSAIDLIAAAWDSVAPC